MKEVHNLDAVREEWEHKLESVLTVTKQVNGYNVVYVVLKKSDGKYNLHRYFPIGERWDVSVDKQHASLEECLEQISSAFHELYPKNKTF